MIKYNQYNLYNIDHLLYRNIHFPPESSSIMLIVKMIAMVKQVCADANSK